MNLASLTQGEVRFAEARYFLKRFKETCRASAHPSQSIEWIAYADAFVTAVISMEEIAGATTAGTRRSSLVSLIKALTAR